MKIQKGTRGRITETGFLKIRHNPGSDNFLNKSPDGGIKKKTTSRTKEKPHEISLRHMRFSQNHQQ